MDNVITPDFTKKARPGIGRRRSKRGTGRNHVARSQWLNFTSLVYDDAIREGASERAIAVRLKKWVVESLGGQYRLHIALKESYDAYHAVAGAAWVMRVLSVFLLFFSFATLQADRIAEGMVLGIMCVITAMLVSRSLPDLVVYADPGAA